MPDRRLGDTIALIYEDDRYEPLPGLLELPAFLLRRLGRRTRLILVLAALAAIGVTVAVIVPVINEGKERQSAADRRAHARAVVRERRRLVEEQRPRHAVAASRGGSVRELEQAITRDARARFRRGLLPPPIAERTRCGRFPLDALGRAALRAGGRLFDCLAVTGPGQGFDFVAVVDYRRLRLTWCKTTGVGLTDVGPLVEVPLDRACYSVVR